MLKRSNFLQSRWAKVALISLVFLVMQLSFVPGYIFVPDMVFVPDMPAPTAVTSIFWFEYLLYLLSKIMPAWVVQRLLLLAILATIFIGAKKMIEYTVNGSSSFAKAPEDKQKKTKTADERVHAKVQRGKTKEERLEIKDKRLKIKDKQQKAHDSYLMTHVSNEATRPIAIVPIFAGALYLLNNFVYTRFMTGQWAVLMGYALLPFILLATLKLLKNPTRKQWLTLGGLLALTGVLSIHFLGISVIMTFIVFMWWAIDERANKDTVKRAAKSYLMTQISWLLLSSYWLLPLILGKGQTADTISSFGVDDLTAYATTGDGIGIFGNLLRLQGFWADNGNLYLLPQDTHWWWWLPLAVLLYLVIKGAFWSYKHMRFYFKIFASLLAAGLVLAAGTKAPIVGLLNQFLVDHIPLFSGYREPQKFAGLIALAYVYFAGCGLLAFAQSNKSVISHQLSVVSRKLSSSKKISVGSNTRLRKTDYGKQKTHDSWLMTHDSQKYWAVFLLVPIFLVPGIFLDPTAWPKTGDYPRGWYQVESVLDREYRGGKVLYLPWHLYMPMEFTGGVVANPAPRFMGYPAVMSSNPELGALNESVQDSAVMRFEKDVLPDLAFRQNLADVLKEDSIEYVVVVKEFDWQKYDVFDGRPSFSESYQDDSIALYKIQ